MVSFAWLPGLSLSVISAIVTSGVIQLFFKARWDERLEVHKAQLSANNAETIERVKSDAVIVAERCRKTFGILADKQAATVETMYEHLVDVHIALLQCVSPGKFGGEPSDLELINTLHQTRWKAYQFFRQKRLFLSSDLSADLDELYSKIVRCEMDYRFRVAREDKKSDDWTLQGTLWDDANGEIAKTLNEIEDKFRKLLAGQNYN